VSATRAPRPVVTTGVPAEVEAALKQPTATRSFGATQMLARYFVLFASAELRDEQKEWVQLRKSFDEADRTFTFVERKHPRTTRIHHRGEFLKPRDPVMPGTPEVLHSLPEGAPRNRLTLAHWLVARDNPLVARVIVNRYWAAFFGRGIVSTNDDFGVRGELPTHPRLLDWLASFWGERDWSIKELHREIATSATYRQSSRVPPELLERDPGNELLARGPRVRMPAEMLRDVTLAASGLLMSRIGGPSVFPPQPEGVTRDAYGRPEYVSSVGADRFRRGLYTFWKRTAPYAAFMTFDAPSREEVCVRRARTNTPLQALTLLNDVVYVEATRALAARILRERGPSEEARLERLFLLTLGRRPAAAEEERILTYRATQEERLRADPAVAELLTAGGAGGDSTGLESAAWAAWVLVARVVLNLDEAVTKA